jgi:hypothetical protein
LEAQNAIYTTWQDTTLSKYIKHIFISI